MINNLKNKIFLIIEIALSIIIIGIVLLFINFTYKNTITSSTMYMDRIGGREDKPEGSDETPPEPRDFSEHQGQEMNDPYSIEVEGVYKVEIRNNTVTRASNDVTDDIKNKALAVVNKNTEEGLVGQYIYKVRKVGNNGEAEVTLMESSEAISRFQRTIVNAIIAGLAGILVIALIANKISKIIVKPVAEAFEKQKQFISDASHELKTPLAVIEANADVLENKMGDSKWLTYIQDEVQSMNKLVNELLVLTRMESSGTTNYQKFSISKEVKMTVAVFESMLFEKGIKLENSIAEGIEFYGEKEDIKQIVSILLDNAIKHTEANNKIKVVVAAIDKNTAKIEVINQGEPIPESERSKIFERFYRVDKARSRNEKRYGLGLAIAKGIVEKYDGSIDVHCKGGFTNFIVIINHK